MNNIEAEVAVKGTKGLVKGIKTFARHHKVALISSGVAAGIVVIGGTVYVIRQVKKGLPVNPVEYYKEFKEAKQKLEEANDETVKPVDTEEINSEE